MIDQKRFLKNVADAIDNGFDLVCAKCGCGTNDEDFEEETSHESDCPNQGRDRNAEALDFLRERMGL